MIPPNSRRTSRNARPFRNFFQGLGVHPLVALLAVVLFLVFPRVILAAVAVYVVYRFFQAGSLRHQTPPRSSSRVRRGGRGRRR